MADLIYPVTGVAAGAAFGFYLAHLHARRTLVRLDWSLRELRDRGVSLDACLDPAQERRRWLPLAGDGEELLLDLDRLAEGAAKVLGLRQARARYGIPDATARRLIRNDLRGLGVKNLLAAGYGGALLYLFHDDLFAALCYGLAGAAALKLGFRAGGSVAVRRHCRLPVYRFPDAPAHVDCR